MGEDDHNRLKRKIEDFPNLVEGSSSESQRDIIEKKSSKRLRVTDANGICDELIDHNEVIDEDDGIVFDSSVQMISNEENGNYTCIAVSHEEIVNVNENSEVDDEESDISNPVTGDECSVNSDGIDIDNNVLVTDEDIPNNIDSTVNSNDADLSDTISWEPQEEDSTIEIVSSMNSFREFEDLDELSRLSFLSSESNASAPCTESNIRAYIEDSRIEESAEYAIGSDMCPICLEKLSFVIGSPDVCEHTFCLDCITQWSKRENTCPVDRMVFYSIVMVLRS